MSSLSVLMTSPRPSIPPRGRGGRGARAAAASLVHGVLHALQQLLQLLHPGGEVLLLPVELRVFLENVSTREINVIRLMCVVCRLLLFYKEISMRKNI